MVTISTSLSIGSVTFATANSDAGKAAFASAVASTLTGVSAAISAANIKNIVVVDVNARRRLGDLGNAYQADADPSEDRRRLAVTTVTVRRPHLWQWLTTTITTTTMTDG